MRKKGSKKGKIHPSEFQRIGRRDKAILKEQCKEIEENNRKRKTRDFKKIRESKDIFTQGWA